jgi:hypothetical protein
VRKTKLRKITVSRFCSYAESKSKNSDMIVKREEGILERGKER